MNRFVFMGTQVEQVAGGTTMQEYCYVFDSETGVTLKSPVKAIGGAPVADIRREVPATVFPVDTIKPPVTAPVAVKETVKLQDPAGDPETPEQRKERISKPKVPAAFSSKMYLDPSKTNGMTDVMPTG